MFINILQICLMFTYTTYKFLSNCFTNKNVKENCQSNFVHCFYSNNSFWNFEILLSSFSLLTYSHFVQNEFVRSESLHFAHFGDFDSDECPLSVSTKTVFAVNLFGFDDPLHCAFSSAFGNQKQCAFDCKLLFDVHFRCIQMLRTDTFGSETIE